MKKGLGSMVKTILATLMIAVLMVANPITAEAKISSDSINYLKEYYSENNKLPSGFDSLLKTSSSGMKDAQTITLKSSNGADKVYSYENANSMAIDNKVSALRSSDNATDAVTNITGDLNLEPDTGKAAEMLTGVTPVISTFLGLAVILITLFMTVFSAIDIVYIVFPATRTFLDNADSKSKIQIVTDDAKFALKQGSIESGKSPMGTYFGRRVVSYVILSVMLFIILTGNISLITNLALKLVSGLLNVLVTI